MIRVEVFATKSDGQWHLQSFCPVRGHVFMLLTFERLIQAIEAAYQLQIHIDNIDDLPLPQYYKERYVFKPFDLDKCLLKRVRT
jgi:hypothetical protein